MTQKSRFWEGIHAGILGPYSCLDFHYFIEKMCQSDPTTQGPLKGKLNELSGAYAAGPKITIQSGLALVKGCLYTNTASIDFAIAQPGSGTNYYRIVLRKDFVAQTIRLARLGPSTVTYPTVTQTDGTIWEIPIIKCSISSTGAHAEVDERVFCIYNTAHW